MGSLPLVSQQLYEPVSHVRCVEKRLVAIRPQRAALSPTYADPFLGRFLSASGSWLIFLAVTSVKFSVMIVPSGSWFFLLSLTRVSVQPRSHAAELRSTLPGVTGRGWRRVGAGGGLGFRGSR